MNEHFENDWTRHTHVSVCVVTNTGYRGQDIQFQRRFLQFTLNPILISIRHLGHRCKIHFRQLPMPIHIGHLRIRQFQFNAILNC